MTLQSDMSFSCLYCFDCIITFSNITEIDTFLASFNAGTFAWARHLKLRKSQSKCLNGVIKWAHTTVPLQKTKGGNIITDFSISIKTSTAKKCDDDEKSQAGAQSSPVSPCNPVQGLRGRRWKFQMTMQTPVSCVKDVCDPAINYDFHTSWGLNACQNE